MSKTVHFWGPFAPPRGSRALCGKRAGRDPRPASPNAPRCKTCETRLAEITKRGPA